MVLTRGIPRMNLRKSPPTLHKAEVLTLSFDKAFWANEIMTSLCRFSAQNVHWKLQKNLYPSNQKLFTRSNFEDCLGLSLPSFFLNSHLEERDQKEKPYWNSSQLLIIKTANLKTFRRPQNSCAAATPVNRIEGFKDLSFGQRYLKMTPADQIF